MRSSIAIALASLLLPSAALAGGVPDAGPEDSGTGACGTVTPEGFCSGAVLTYCDTDTSTVVVIDCAEGDPTTTCIEIDPTYGVDCAAAVGAECLFEDQNGDFFSLFCQGTNAGCAEGLLSANCVENVGPCTDDSVGTCVGDRLVVECVINQPYMFACDAFGGTCSGGTCVGATEGNPCSREILCAEGLDCVNDECTARADAGVLPDSGTPDAGAGSADATAGLFDTGVGGPRDGGTAEAEDDGCGCSSTSRRSGTGAALFTVLAALLVLRRRWS